ncbi:PREDICTED: uncharacterized protein LOC105154707 [Acromyrmex echinatior]|uniref:uncharacterized protein LOC105154707 n=1 Tax=Acromyrmex echinatior TaxID=103372 RepID=UPI000580E1F5|nr:PREDICTED: uncharacterized protein LOC105154707 [Acromyrmex echinatior]
MKIPLLILCLTVVYGACQTYDEGDYVTKVIQNNGDYKNSANVPFERSLARYKRTILSVIPTPINALRSLLEFNDVKSTDKNFMTFISDLLTGKDVSEIASANISTLLNQFKKVIQNTVNFGRGIINALFDKMFEVAKVFFLKVFLPVLHAVLNKAKDTGILPEQMNTMITAFNILYKVLQITKQVPS